MTHAHLRFRIRFAKSAAERFVVKKRIVPESVRSAWLMNYSTLHYASECSYRFAVEDERDYAQESRGAISHSM